MKNIQYKNEWEFVNEFYSELKKELGNNYIVEKEKNIDYKFIDLFVKNNDKRISYYIDFKGRSQDNSLPPEIIPSLDRIKNKIKEPNNVFIIFSFSKLNDNIKNIFNQSNYEIFEYDKTNKNVIKDFVKFLENLPPTKAISNAGESDKIENNE